MECQYCKKCVEKAHKTAYNDGDPKNRRDAGMDNAELDKVGPIQRYYYEDMMCRRDNEVEKWHKAWKYTFFALAIMAVLFIASWVGFIYYEQQFTDEVTETIETYTEGGGNAYGTLVSGDGSIVNYGESQSDTHKAPNP